MSQRRKSNPPKTKSSAPVLPIFNPHAAGIDIGARQIHVAVPPAAPSQKRTTRDAKPVSYVIAPPPRRLVR